jgi:hypothetical protein
MYLNKLHILPKQLYLTMSLQNGEHNQKDVESDYCPIDSESRRAMGYLKNLLLKTRFPESYYLQFISHEFNFWDFLTGCWPNFLNNILKQKVKSEKNLSYQVTCAIVWNCCENFRQKYQINTFANQCPITGAKLINRLTIIEMLQVFIYMARIHHFSKVEIHLSGIYCQTLNQNHSDNNSWCGPTDSG